MATPVLYRVIYGTSTPESWQNGSLRVRPALLPSYCRYHVKNVDYPGIVPEAGKSVRGTCVEGLTEMDIWRLDIFEGTEYTRKVVQIKILDKEGNETGEEKEATTYEWVAGEDELEDEEWDFQHFVKEKLSFWTSDVKEYEEIDRLGGRWWEDAHNDSAVSNNAPGNTTA
ncbi:hypothetical protein L873DRAFT_1670109 [Choiromyces venosus 120613-1]|uniref:Putative gamma-glutamylcyclotransferase n=1 Tax=Choiromyces venosus 120613-1 TaxID=1336337 RepID=A0A3N4JYT4_9PEZI|nr:hypothetical protein L873DRAFT_1670109 [Choiromyces venosus 120613-1]